MLDRPLNRHLSKLKSRLDWILAIDWGWNCGYVLSCATPHQIIFFDSEVTEGELFDDTLTRLKNVIEEFPNIYLIADPGGSAKTLIETLRQTHQIPIQSAEKTDKLTNIAALNRDLSLGLIKFYNAYDEEHPEELELVKNCNSLIWQERNEIRIEGEPRHLTDCMLYSWRFWKKNLFIEKKVPKFDNMSPEQFDAYRMDKYLEELRRPQLTKQVGFTPEPVRRPYRSPILKKKNGI
jgi:hypothetical protein